MIKYTTLFLMTIILAGLLAGCSKKEPPAPPADEATLPAPAELEATEPASAEPVEAKPAGTGELGQKAAPLEGLTYIKGAPVTFEAGKVYVVEFWATWCSPCKASIPHLTDVQEKFKDQGVTVIGISREDVNTVKPFVEDMGEKMDYTVAVDTEGKVYSGYMGAFRQRGIPAAFIVDGQGNVAWLGHPMSPVDGMDETLEQIIAGTFDTATYAKDKAEREAAKQELGKLIKKYLADLRRGAAIKETRPTAEKIFELNMTNGLYALARHIMLTPNVDDANRDMEMALKAAKKACDETNHEEAWILDTYALVLSKANQLEEAVAVQQKAVEMAAGEEGYQADLKKRLDEYKDLLEKQAAKPAESVEIPAPSVAPAE